MNSPAPKYIHLDRSKDGARILWRHFLSTQPGSEGWVREFDGAEKHVRISRTNSGYDAGKWYRINDLRIEAVLDEAKAPALATKDDEKAAD